MVSLLIKSAKVQFDKATPEKKHKVKFVNVENKLANSNIFDYIEKHQNDILQENLDDKCWTLADKRILILKEKIERIGKPLREWDVRIYRGLLTGYNEAFIIDNETKERLCKEDPKSAEILKPILRGRDIGRYYYKWAGLWVIATFPALHLNIDDYPAIKKYLLSYGKERLEQSGKTLPDGTKARKKTTNKWFETQDTIAYYPELEKEKIVWQEIVREPSFAYDSGEFYCEATSFLMTGYNLKYLIAVLNSKPATFFFKQFYAGGGLGKEGYRYKKAFLEQLPIPKISERNQQPFIDLVNKILSLTKSKDYLENAQQQGIIQQGVTQQGVTQQGVAAPCYAAPCCGSHYLVKEYERQIDQLVYKLYGLTEEEIRIVEGETYV